MDCIKLLPDHVANQIAAGEVVQRPASVVKELLENSLDAGATDIRLQVREGGSLMIRITDNGAGMSPADARMCWERHATSKLRQADDLFRISSFGFRGEALASIAAVSMVEMKTKRKEDETGTLVKIEGGRVLEQSPEACLNGTQFIIKNLFYNIPARRNFLKSQAVELRHIIDEFTRVAMPHHQVAFSLSHNDKEIFDLQPTSKGRRIAELLGKKNETGFIPVIESHDLLDINGFIGMPETAKRTRGEQFLFVNNRYIRDPYLHHAIVNAYDQMISKDQFPLYVLFLETDPSRIDVNIHPTKTEIKFDDERAMYALVRSAVLKSLGQATSIPGIELTDVNTFNPVGFTRQEDQVVSRMPEIKVNRSFNPFADPLQKTRSTRNWQTIFGNPYLEQESPGNQTEIIPEKILNHPVETINGMLSLGNGYIAARQGSELLLIDQRAAHERVLYEKYLRIIRNKKPVIQKLLFPRTVELSGTDYALAHELFDELASLGFDVADFGKNCLIINGVPGDSPKGCEKELLEGMLEEIKNGSTTGTEDRMATVALALASHEAILRMRNISAQETEALIGDLFNCEFPAVRPNGKPVFIRLGKEMISGFFR